MCFGRMFRLLLTAVQIPMAQAHSTLYELTVTCQHVKKTKHMNHFLCTLPSSLQQTSQSNHY